MSGAWPSSRAGQHQLGLRRRAVDHDPDLVADPRLPAGRPPGRAAVRMTASRRAALTAAGTSSVHRKRARAFLVRVREDADVVEAGVADEVLEFLEVRSVSPGKPTMNVVRKVTPGTRARMRASSLS